MLTGEAKKAYQREYMRDYMRSKRVKIQIKTPDVKTPKVPIKASPCVGLNNSASTPVVRPTTIEIQPAKPLRLYDSTRDKPGDKVLVRQGKKIAEITVPETDADGNPIPW